MLKKFIKPLFFSRRFYWGMVAIILLFIFSYAIPVLFPFIKLLLLFFVVLLVLDYVVLFLSDRLHMRRIVPDTFSNGDENKVQVIVSNQYSFKVRVHLIDELPDQFQKRNFNDFSLSART